MSKLYRIRFFESKSDKRKSKTSTEPGRIIQHLKIGGACRHRCDIRDVWCCSARAAGRGKSSALVSWMEAWLPGARSSWTCSGKS